MLAFHFTRRAALAAILMGASSATMLTVPATARPAPAGGVRVDVGPLLENSGRTDRRMGCAPIAGRDRGGARRLRTGRDARVRPDRLRHPGAEQRRAAVRPARTLDQMSEKSPGAGSRSRCARQTFYYPAASDQAMFEQANFDRVAQLCQAFAGWIAKGY